MRTHGVARRPGTAGLLALAAAIAMAPLPARAGWLDEAAPAGWNQAGAGVPRAPAEEGNDDPRCRRAERPPETPADRAVARAGWKLFREYQAGWGAKVVWGVVTYDGMCRPMAYQAFVFVGDAFAGTLSPSPMRSRTDGALTAVTLVASTAGRGDAVVATFARYADADPLCCPSRTTHVRYRVAGAGRAAAVVPTAVDTLPAAR